MKKLVYPNIDKLRNPSVNVSQILSIFTHASTEDRRLFAQGDGVYSRGFPNLVRQIQSRVSPADFSRIQSAMAP